MAGALEDLEELEEEQNIPQRIPSEIIHLCVCQNKVLSKDLGSRKNPFNFI